MVHYKNIQCDYIVEGGMVAWLADWLEAISHMELRHKRQVLQ